MDQSPMTSKADDIRHNLMNFFGPDGWSNPEFRKDMIQLYGPIQNIVVIFSLKRGKLPGVAEWEYCCFILEFILEIAQNNFAKETVSVDVGKHCFALAQNCCKVLGNAITGLGCNDTAGAQILRQMVRCRIKKMISDYLDATSDISSKTGNDLLIAINKRWTHLQFVIKSCSDMFSSLNELSVTVASPPVFLFRRIALECFYSAVYQKYKDSLCKILLEQIRKEREGIKINRAAMKKAIQIFVEMGMGSTCTYEKDLESHFLAATSAFYKELSSAWLNKTGGNLTYLKHVEKCINDEEMRVINYLHVSTRVPLIHCVELELLTRHRVHILKNVESLFGNWETDDWTRMYTLLKRIPDGLDRMAFAFGQLILDKVMYEYRYLRHGKKNGNQSIDSCLELHDRFSRLITGSFEESDIFHKARKEAFKVFTNRRLQIASGGCRFKISISELVYNHCDDLMKNGKMNSDKRDEKLHKVIRLFTQCKDHDLFQQLYCDRITEWFFTNKMENDNENPLISKLKQLITARCLVKLLFVANTNVTLVFDSQDSKTNK